MRHFISEKYWWVKQLNIFQDLSVADAYSLDRIISDKKLKHEERIVEEGVYFIREGRIKITEDFSDKSDEKTESRSMNPKSEEKQETKAVLEAGEVFGVFANDDMVLGEDSETISYAECLTEVCLGIATFRDFSFLLKRKPYLTLPLHRRALLDTFIRNKKRNKKNEPQLSYHNILNVSKTKECKDFNAFSNIVFRTASSRFALLLLNLATGPDRRGIVLVPRLSPKRFSRLVGTSIETIDQLIKTFKQHKVIEKYRGRIQIVNTWQLKKIADARMKTLAPLKEATVIPDDDIDFAALLSGQTEEVTESASTSNVK